MKVDYKKTAPTHAEITVVLEAPELKAAEKEAVRRLARDVKVQGFRKGKAPLELARQQLPANQLNETTLDIAIRASVPKVFTEAKLEPVEHPHLEVTKFVPGATVEYHTALDVLGEIKLGKYRGLKAKRLTPTVGKKEVDAIVNQIADHFAERKVAKRAAATGDEVTIDFTGTVDGKEFPGGKARDFKLILGSGQFIPGFEDGIVGHKSGDKFDVKVTFPKNYQAANLAGRDAVFAVLLKQVSEVIRPELDNKFAQKCGPFPDMPALRADIKQNLTAQQEAKIANKYKDDLVKEVVANSRVDVPPVMAEDQYQFIRRDVEKNGQAQGLSFEEFVKKSGLTLEKWEKEARETAAKRVQMMLVLRELSKIAGIKVTDAEVDAKIAEVKEHHQGNAKAQAQLDTPAARNDLANRLVVDKTLEWLVAEQQAAEKSAK